MEAWLPKMRVMSQIMPRSWLCSLHKLSLWTSMSFEHQFITQRAEMQRCTWKESEPKNPIPEILIFRFVCPDTTCSSNKAFWRGSVMDCILHMQKQRRTWKTGWRLPLEKGCHFWFTELVQIHIKAQQLLTAYVRRVCVWVLLHELESFCWIFWVFIQSIALVIRGWVFPNIVWTISDCYLM